MDVSMDGLMDRQTDTWIYGQMNGLTDRQIKRHTDGLIDRLMD